MAQEETFHEKVIFEERRRSSMKKQRRIIAMILVLAFVFAFMTMSASATTPRGVVCGDCGSTNTTTYLKTTNVTNVYVSSCGTHSYAHYHIQRTPVYQFKCYSCGDAYTYYGTSTYTCNG